VNGRSCRGVMLLDALVVIRPVSLRMTRPHVPESSMR